MYIRPTVLIIYNNFLNNRDLNENYNYRECNINNLGNCDVDGDVVSVIDKQAHNLHYYKIISV